MIIENMLGLKFNKWTVISFEGISHNQQRLWKLKCDCGYEVIRDLHDAKRGRSKQCSGCYVRQTTLSHGHNKRGKRSSEYSSWASMKERCLNPNKKDYKHYGGRGITICQQWIDSFDNYLSDMGLKPGKGYSIDRINVDGNYEPSNCRWATQKEQMNNIRGSKKKE
jgi:hypothetical protein